MPPAELADLSLCAVPREEAPILANLLELYCHDMSVYFPVELGADGRFGYPKLPLYFSEPNCCAFFLMAGGKRVGFALATRGSPASDDPRHLDVAEFFVLRQYRRHGVGERAAALLWDQLAGHWLVRVAEVNTPAVAFWRRAVSAYTGSAPPERKIVQGGKARIVLELDSR